LGCARDRRHRESRMSDRSERITSARDGRCQAPSVTPAMTPIAQQWVVRR
jgi:hypothetical protein